MTARLRTLLSNGSAALLCALALGVAGCDAADPATDDVASALVADGWSFVDSDVSPANSYAIRDDGLDLNWSGYYRWPGTRATGYRGYRFARPADLVDGETYQVALTVKNVSIPIPVILRASLSGGGDEQSHMFFGDGTAVLNFTVASPGDAPVLEVTAHPILGQIGPLDGIGILIQSYRVTAAVTLAP